jgi:two-component system CheB/CheR fusion protein
VPARRKGLKIEPHDQTEIDCLRAVQFLATERLAASALISQDAVIGLSSDGLITAWSPAAQGTFGYTPEEAVGQSIAIIATTEMVAQQNDFLARLRSGEFLGPVEMKRKRKDGVLIDVSATAAPIKSKDGLVEAMWISIRNVSERKEAERQQMLMTRELTHRVKNSYAILQSIMHSTLRTTPTPGEFARVFSHRLHSLSAAQDVLTANNWMGVELGSLARHQLAAYDRLDNVKLLIEGPEVYLAPDYASPFGLIFNELAANAQTHGAWSASGGKVDLHWQVIHNDASPSRLLITWKERGGPRPAEIRLPGLGVVLIERSLAGAEVINTYEAEGLTCHIALDITVLPHLEKPVI